jgi:hypothetical protein
VRDWHDSFFVYKKKLKMDMLPSSVQSIIKHGREKAIAKDTFFYGDFSRNKEKIEVYASKDIIDIYEKELGYFNKVHLCLSNTLYEIVMYGNKLIEALSEKDQQKEEFVSTIKNEEEEFYICKKQKNYYLFGVLFNAKDIDKQRYYMHVNGKLHVFADKFLEIDQESIDKLKNEEIE